MNKPIENYVQRIISGGQTGADQGALAAAKRFGIPTGGWAPKGWRTEKGNQELTLKNEYGLLECPTYSYRGRTGYNIKWGDITLVFAAKLNSAGTKFTVQECIKQGKPYIEFPLEYLPKNKGNEYRLKLKDVGQTVETTADQIIAIRHNTEFPLVINVAGNRESVSLGIYHFTDNFIFNLLTTLKEKINGKL